MLVRFCVLCVVTILVPDARQEIAALGRLSCNAKALMHSTRQVLKEVDMQTLIQIARHVLFTYKLHPELYSGLS